jgi:hypothetical protein
LPSNDQPGTPRDRDELLDDVYGRARRLWYQRRVLPVGAAVVALAALLTGPVLLRESDSSRQIAATDEPTTTDVLPTTTLLALEQQTTTIAAAAPVAPSKTHGAAIATTSTTAGPSPQGPPDGSLESASGKVQGQQASYCWNAHNPDGTTSGFCADTTEPDPDDVLAVRRGEMLALRYATEAQPREVHGWIRTSRGADEFSVPDANPAQFAADFAPGTYTIWFSSLWADGDGSHWFKISVTE